MRKPRILIADDHPLLAEGIAGILRNEFDVIGTVHNGREVIAEAERLLPDLITLDIGMPELNGLEAARRLHKQMPHIKLVFVTQLVDLRYLRAALQAGAIAFVAKQTASSELLTAVRKALRGSRYITPLLEDVFADEPAGSGHADKEPLEVLTPRQREVLQMVAEGHTARYISEKLQISRKTVEFHKNSVIMALGLRTTADLIRFAVAQGIVNS